MMRVFLSIRGRKRRRSKEQLTNRVREMKRMDDERMKMLEEHKKGIYDDEKWRRVLSL